MVYLLTFKGGFMIIQSKTLKDILKQLKIKDSFGTLRVRCKTNKHGEYGPAIAHVRSLSKDEILMIKLKLKYVRIENFPKQNFAIITYPD
jgi:hypothetical protein